MINTGYGLIIIGIVIFIGTILIFINTIIQIKKTYNIAISVCQDVKVDGKNSIGKILDIDYEKSIIKVEYINEKEEKKIASINILNKKQINFHNGEKIPIKYDEKDNSRVVIDIEEVLE